MIRTAALPLWAASAALHPRWRKHWRGRIGWELPAVSPGAVWVHAASVGEVRAAAGLVRHLSGPVLLTADTDTGVEVAAAVAASLGPRVAVSVRPIDHPSALGPLFSEARPTAVVFVEGAWWPALAQLARGLDVPVLRVSARAGPRTRRVPTPIYRWFTRQTTAVLAKDERERLFFAETCATVLVTGDLKAASVPVGTNPLSWGRPFRVGASLRDGDSERLLPHGGPWLLAPRYPERFDVRVLDGRRWVRRTALRDGIVPPDVDVVLLDTLGELDAALLGADVAFIGGTFDERVGGHSPWGAAAAGVPIVAGPYGWAQGSAFDDLGAVRVRGPAELGDALATAQPPHPIDPDVGARTAAAIRPFLRSQPSRPLAPRGWAAPVAPVVAGVTSAWHAAWDHGLLRPKSVPVPVVSVGSTDPRGPGKTVVARWVSDELMRRGHRVGVALRGYGRRTGSRLACSWLGAHRLDLGDEGAMHAARHLVAVGADRVAAARALVEAGATVVVLDDGLQHRALHRDVDLLVLQAGDPGARGMMPAGDRREERIHPARVSGAVALGGSLPGAIRASAVPGPWQRGSTGCELPDGPLVAFVGIGRPSGFVEGLPDRVQRVWRLRDHEPIDGDMLARWTSTAGRGGTSGASVPLLCTEKDRMRLPDAWFDEVYWRGVSLQVHDPVPEAWWPR